MKVKNKKAEQAKKRNAHRERLKRGKARREAKPTILIVCEGEKTEPSYFKKFKLKTAKVLGEGYNTLSLIEQAKK